MAGEISSQNLDWNTEYLNFNFNLWQLRQMWLETPQKWQTWTNLGTSVFLKGFLVTGFDSYLNKEQFGLMWPTTPKRWQVNTKIDFFCSLTRDLDIGLKTLASTSKLLPLSN